MNKTFEAFESFRTEYGPARSPKTNSINHPDECLPLCRKDGLDQLTDGPCQYCETPPEETPILTDEELEEKNLWAIRQKDVVFAKEKCTFGKRLNPKVIKHTNLTGGEKAYGGGEIIFLDSSTLIVNGCSGRYGIRSEKEMRSLAQAFKKSGYNVWSMGYDTEADWAYRFNTVDPKWI